MDAMKPPRIRPIWSFPTPPSEEQRRALSRFPAPMQGVFASRGLDSEKEIANLLNPSAPIDHPPELLPNMDPAVRRLAAAIRSGERIVIYGDYDADGVTASALLVNALRKEGANCEAYIPNRFDEGYGLNAAAVENLARGGYSLLVSVDCGVRALEESHLARRLGLELIVTDHHLPGSELPAAAAIVNPHLPDSRYPYPDLAGVGLAYKLAEALAREFNNPAPVDLLDLVAIGTVADMAPLQSENRDLTRRGIALLNEQPRLGLAALLRIAGLQQGQITSSTIGFTIGPRLNAAGRLQTAMDAYRLLMSNDPMEAEALAARLDRINRQRQELTRNVVDQALNLVAAQEEAPLIFVSDPDFHEGVVGLAASRLSQMFYRPAIVGTRGEHTTRASARSISGFHITQALDACEGLLIRYGGHAAAAGFSVENDKLDALEAQLQAYAADIMEDLPAAPVLRIDALASIAEMTEDVMRVLEGLEPYGQGNGEPVFCSRDVRVLEKRAVGSGKSHLKLTLDAGGRAMDAIGFGLGELVEMLPGKIDIAYRLQRNTFMGVMTLQCNVLDVRPSGEQAP